MSRSPGDSPGDRAESTEFTESDHHRLLAAERRRVALEVLATEAIPVRLGMLAKAIAARDDDDRDDDEHEERPRDERVHRIAVELHHNHLPLMTDMGVVRYEPESRRIEAVELSRTLRRT